MSLTNSPQLFAPCVALLAIALLYFVAQQRALYARREVFKRAHGCKPALWHRDQRGPFRYFGLDILIINARRMRNHQHLSNIQQRLKDFGVNTFEANLGGVPFFLTLEPENLKAIQSSQHEIWSLGDRRRWAFNFMLGQGIFSTDGKQWQHSRDMLRPSFVRAQNDDTSKFEHHVQNLVRLIPTGGHMVDLSPLFHALTLDTSTELLFGESASVLLKDGPGKQLGDSFARGQTAIMKRAQFGRLGTFLLIREDSRVESDFRFVQQFADRYVGQALARKDEIRSRTAKPSRYIFLEELVRQSDDPIRIRSELLNILVAGRDTTASLLTNLFWVMSRNPDVWTKLQHEISSSLRDPDRLPSFDELKSMKYLRALLNETLRLYPPVPFNTRQATEDTVLPRGGGPDERSPILIPKDTFVAWSVHAMHRRTDLFGADAEAFRPERWLDDPVTGAKGLRPSWEYLPFNGGARVCLGQNYALIEASYVTVRLCQVFAEIEPVDVHEPWTELLSLTCVNKFGAKVVLTRREREDEEIPRLFERSI